MEADLRDASILIVDDETANVTVLERLLRRERYTNVASTTDSREALSLYRRLQPDLVLLDLAMPYLDGAEVMRQIVPLVPPGDYVPILVLTADVTFDTKRRALESGARDFLTKPFDHVEVLLRIRNLLEARYLHLELARRNARLEEEVRERTERLLQTEKVAMMGSLLAGVAHELNNPLAIVMARAELLLTKADAAVTRQVVPLHNAAKRCVRIVRNFLSLARQRPPERRELSVNQVVDEAIELLAYELRTNDVMVAVDLGEELPRVRADGHQLHQVLVNLVVNANQALQHQPPPRRVTIRILRRVDPPGVRVEVADNGPGIPATIKDRIFEPFFTTKPPGEGTGLGLSLSRRMIEEHGGRLTLESEEGAGTMFVIELPLASDGDATSPATPEAEAEPGVAPARLLVVDDEPALSAVLAESLRVMGHTVDVADHGAHALEMLERSRYDAVFSDTKMPVVDGVELFRAVEQRFPSLRRRFIFVTGDTTLSAGKLRFIEATGAPVILKPFDLREVSRVLARVLPPAPASP